MVCVWNIDGVLDFAKAKWSEGVSGGAIEAAIRHKFRSEFSRHNIDAPSRAAIIGKMNREKAFTPHSRSSAAGRSQRAQFQMRQQRAAAKAVAAPKKVAAKAPRAPLGPPRIMPEAFVPISGFTSPPERRIYQYSELDVPRPQLGDPPVIKHCRWIEGDPKGLFRKGNTTSYVCGCEAETGDFCNQHRAAAYPGLVKADKPVNAKSEVQRKELEKCTS